MLRWTGGSRARLRAEAKAQPAILAEGRPQRHVVSSLFASRRRGRQHDDVMPALAMRNAAPTSGSTSLANRDQWRKRPREQMSTQHERRVHGERSVVTAAPISDRAGPAERPMEVPGADQARDPTAHSKPQRFLMARGRSRSRQRPPLACPRKPHRSRTATSALATTVLEGMPPTRLAPRHQSLAVAPTRREPSELSMMRLSDSSSSPDAVRALRQRNNNEDEKTVDVHLATADVRVDGVIDGRVVEVVNRAVDPRVAAFAAEQRRLQRSGKRPPPTAQATGPEEGLLSSARQVLVALRLAKTKDKTNAAAPRKTKAHVTTTQSLLPPSRNRAPTKKRGRIPPDAIHVRAASPHPHRGVQHHAPTSPLQDDRHSGAVDAPNRVNRDTRSLPSGQRLSDFPSFSFKTPAVYPADWWRVAQGRRSSVPQSSMRSHPHPPPRAASCDNQKRQRSAPAPPRARSCGPTEVADRSGVLSQQRIVPNSSHAFNAEDVEVDKDEHGTGAKERQDDRSSCFDGFDPHQSPELATRALEPAGDGEPIRGEFVSGRMDEDEESMRMDDTRSQAPPFCVEVPGHRLVPEIPKAHQAVRQPAQLSACVDRKDGADWPLRSTNNVQNVRISPTREEKDRAPPNPPCSGQFIPSPPAAQRGALLSCATPLHFDHRGHSQGVLTPSVALASRDRCRGRRGRGGGDEGPLSTPVPASSVSLDVVMCRRNKRIAERAVVRSTAAKHRRDLLLSGGDQLLGGDRSQDLHRLGQNDGALEDEALRKKRRMEATAARQVGHPGLGPTAVGVGVARGRRPPMLPLSWTSRQLGGGPPSHQFPQGFDETVSNGRRKDPVSGMSTLVPRQRDAQNLPQHHSAMMMEGGPLHDATAMQDPSSTFDGASGAYDCGGLQHFHSSLPDVNVQTAQYPTYYPQDQDQYEFPASADGAIHAAGELGGDVGFPEQEVAFVRPPLLSRRHHLPHDAQRSGAMSFESVPPQRLQSSVAPSFFEPPRGQPHPCQGGVHQPLLNEYMHQHRGGDSFQPSAPPRRELPWPSPGYG